MNNSHFLQKILFACLMVVCGGQVKAETVKCVDDSGSVTYTNLPCQSDADAARGISLNSSNEVKERPMVPVRVFALGWEAREGAAVKLRIAKRRVSLDVNTVKAAKFSTMEMDKATPVLQQRNLVALDLRNPGWFDFR
jgi:hypothetical protein